MIVNGMTRRQVLIGAGALLLASSTWATPYETPVQPVDIWRSEWRDAHRNRTVPIKIYFPHGAGPFPVIVFSHGLGGSREGYEYLGRYWAAHGYVSVHLQHPGSDDSVWRGGLGMAGMRDAISAQTARDRALDVHFALDQLQRLNTDSTWPLHGKLDLRRIGMAGHSFGANTTLLIAGMATLGGALTDPRVQCAVALSSPTPVSKNYDALYAGIKIPMLHMTGTQDISPVDPANSRPSDRRIPYDHSHGADAYLVTFANGDHMLFSGREPLTRHVPSDERNHQLIQEAATAFWDAYLKRNQKALVWLRDGFAKELGSSGVWEQKRGKPHAG